MDRVGQAIMGTGDVDRNIEVSDAGITPRGSAGSSPDLLSMGVETFADGMVSRPDQGQRIDPNRFDTGTLTEAEARRIEGSEGGLFDALRKGANAMFGAADVAKEVPIDRSGQKVDMGGKTLPNTFQNRGGFSLADIYNEYAPRIKRSVMGAENQMDMPDPEGMLVTGFSGQDSVDANAYQSGTGDVPGPGPVEEAQARAARAVDTTIDDGDLRSMPFRDFDDGDLRSMPEEQTTLADQVEQVNKATEDLKPKTVEKDDPDAAKTALDAANDQADAMTKAAQTTADDEFSKRIEELMDPAAKGEFRKETEALVKNREERLKSAKKEAFSMALLQAGLGMLGQGGGQTALQALGKAALPATKDYAAAIKDAKKEDRELLQLGLSLEQMDAKEAAATKRVVAQLHGDRAKAMLTSATSMANNVRTTAASMYSADVTGRVGMAKADAMSEQARQTGALRQDLNRADNLRMERSELNDLVDKQAAALQEDPTYSMAKMIEQAAYAKLAKDPQNETLRAEFMLAQNEAQKAQEAFMASSPYAKLIQEQRGVVQSLGTSAVDFSSLNP
jgi:hypothetical protein